MTSDMKHIVQLNDDGTYFVHRIDDGRSLLQGAYIDSEVVIMTEDGRYDTSYEGAQSVQLRFAGLPGLFAFRQFDTVLHRPGLAKAMLEGRLSQSDRPFCRHRPRHD